MTDTPFKGGKNNFAPYNTTHLRVPLEIKDSLQNIIDLYKRAYKLEADNFRLDLVSSLKGFSRIFLGSHGVLVDSRDCVTIEKHTEVLKKLEEANRKIALLTPLEGSSRDACNQAREILASALDLRANAGGAIKKEIRKAIALLD